MTSLWLDRPWQARPAYQPGGSDSGYDVVVVGAGLTGLVTALLLARAGQRVAVVEGRTVGAVTTGNTTAKISLLHSGRLAPIAQRHPVQTLRAYVDANREGQEWLLRYCDEHGVPVQRRPAYSYAETEKGAAGVAAELEAARHGGLDAQRVTDTELPYDVVDAIRVDDQAQFDPLDALEAMVGDLEQHGGTLFENTRVRTVRGERDNRIVVTEHGDLRTRRVVLATGVPILDRGGFFARMEPQRSYALSLRADHPETVVQGMYLSLDALTRSIRSAPTDAGELVLVGGNGHTVGRHPSPRGQRIELRTWALDRFAGKVTHEWSAQDYTASSDLPLVGRLLPHDDRIYVATGFHKWGMTNGVAAALTISNLILGEQRPAWSKAMEAWSLHELRGLTKGLSVNARVGFRMATGWMRPFIEQGEPGQVAEGSGLVTMEGRTPVAACNVGGQQHRVSAVCPHLGGVVTWNDAEHSWDCPLHGSRFAPDGTVLEGPATSGLADA